MKIAKIDTHLVRLPYTTGGSGNIGNMDWTTLDYVLVRIETEGGLVGWGDAFAYGGAARATRAVVDHMLAPSLIGKDAAAIGQLSYYLQQGNHLLGRYGITMFAISGIDIALWDLAGKAAGQPVSTLLGGARRSESPPMPRCSTTPTRIRWPNIASARWAKGTAPSSCMKPPRPRSAPPASPWATACP